MSNGFWQGVILGSSVSLAVVSVAHFIRERKHKEREEQLYTEAKHLAARFREKKANHEKSLMELSTESNQIKDQGKKHK